MSEEAQAAPMKGWAEVAGSRKFHYCGPDGRSLCGRYGFLGFTQADLSDKWHEHPLNCSVCKKKQAALSEAVQ